MRVVCLLYMIPSSLQDRSNEFYCPLQAETGYKPRQEQQVHNGCSNDTWTSLQDFVFFYYKCAKTRSVERAFTLPLKPHSLLKSITHPTSCHRTVHWFRCRLNFSLLRSAIMCLRGSCSTVNHPARPFITGNNIDLACSEGQVPE